ncbi:MAG: TIGR04255 family protein [Methanobrevibacter sp.]|jgi:uncharacterized protein (TIGR04255 family)|nr:TIGR04255 family protein [Candidatus Methanovirga meridionalis]
MLFCHKNNNYNTFDEFSKTIELILKALSDYPIKKIKYIGLRYINQINLDDGKLNDWDDSINKDLHVITPNFVDSKNILRSMHSLEFKEQDYYIQFNFGQFNSVYPNPISKKEFILDYTCRCKDYNDIDNVQKITE